MRNILFVAAFQAISAVAWAQSPDGRTTFQSLCSGCHGTDGNGGEHAPSILPSLATKNDEELTRIVREGVPRKGMPAFKQMPDADLRALVALYADPPAAARRPPRNARPAKRTADGWYGTGRLRARPHRPGVAAADRRSAHSPVAQIGRAVPPRDDAGRLAEHAWPVQRKSLLGDDADQSRRTSAAWR